MSSATQSSPHYRVLVLDDIQANLRMTKLILESQLSCTVTTYGRTQDVLELETEDLPDLYLLDIITEGLDTIELCRELKAKPETSHIPVIFLSAHGNCESRVSALQAGGVDYIDKPFYPEELIARIRNQINLHQSSYQLQKQAAEQQALLRVLCHDLQNPVAAVSSLLDLSGESDESSEEYLPLARISIQSALDLIQHVRDYRNLIEKGQSYTLEDVSLEQAFREVRLINQSRAQTKGVEIEVELEGHLVVRINRVVLIHNILNNLLSNAIKFSRPGGKVSLTAHRFEKRDDRIVIEIIDDGIGMNDETVRNLFDPKKNHSREGTNHEIGLGFGMPLVKRYVDFFHGKILVESTEMDTPSPEARHGTKVSLFFEGKAG